MARLPDLRESLIDAARRGAPSDVRPTPTAYRPRHKRRRLATVLTLLVLGTAAALFVERDSGPRGHARTAGAAPHQPPRPAGYGEQRALLAVLRHPRSQDREPDVTEAANRWKQARLVRGVRATHLLTRTRSGQTFVLIAARRYLVASRPGGEHTGRPRRDRWLRDGLCLDRRRGHHHAGRCFSTADLLGGRMAVAMEREVYGLVPDRVAYVRPADRRHLVPVTHNLYVYTARSRRARIAAPAWYDRSRRPLTVRLPRRSTTGRPPA